MGQGPFRRLFAPFPWARGAAPSGGRSKVVLPTEEDHQIQNQPFHCWNRSSQKKPGCPITWTATLASTQPRHASARRAGITSKAYGGETVGRNTGFVRLAVPTSRVSRFAAPSDVEPAL